MTGYLDYDEYPDDLDTPVEMLRGEVESAARALEALTSALDSRPAGAADYIVEKAERHRGYLADFVEYASATCDLVEANPHAVHDTDLMELVHSLAEDIELGQWFAYYLHTVEAPGHSATLDRWAALLADKAAGTAGRLAFARRVHLRALTAVRCQASRATPRPRTPDARRRRCQLARMVTASTDDPLPVRSARCPSREPLSRLAPTHERPGAPTGP
jgi:hypothetical protein